MDKKTFCKKIMLWTAIAVATVMLILGICFGKVIEANIYEEIGKWIVVTIGVICICEVFAYILSPLIFHIKYDNKNDKDLKLD